MNKQQLEAIEATHLRGVGGEWALAYKEVLYIIVSGSRGCHWRLNAFCDSNMAPQSWDREKEEGSAIYGWLRFRR